MSTYEISKSSLLSLKAEILKKQEEIKQQKHVKSKVDVKKGPIELKNKGVDDRNSRDLQEKEDGDLLKKSKEILEAKARLYEKLSAGGSVPENEKHKYLVDFGRGDDNKRYESEEDDVNSDAEEYNAANSDDEWVEYTDCLGRTRTCLRKDLEFLKRKDESLKDAVEAREQSTTSPIPQEQDKEPAKEETSKDSFNESSELLSSDMRRELLRKQWEKEEEELTKKNDIHYQDILFNEARMHGTGYYAFSRDEEERRKQQEELKKLRQETEQQQKLASEIRKRREEQLAARVLAAKNRKRARMGLPPLTEDDEPKPVVSEPEVAEPNTTQSEAERLREMKRKQHIRPWDKDKEGVRKEHYEYSQEEWVDIQRKKRESEFAPPRAYHSKVLPGSYEEDKKSLYFSTKKVKTQTAVPIDDELEEPERKKDRVHQSKRKGAAIPPPATFDYYGPSSSKHSRNQNNSCDMEDSIMEGLKLLREKVETQKKY